MCWPRSWCGHVNHPAAPPASNGGAILGLLVLIVLSSGGSAAAAAPGVLRVQAPAPEVRAGVPISALLPLRQARQLPQLPPALRDQEHPPVPDKGRAGEAARLYEIDHVRGRRAGCQPRARVVRRLPGSLPRMVPREGRARYRAGAAGGGEATPGTGLSGIPLPGGAAVDAAAAVAVYDTGGASEAVLRRPRTTWCLED